MHFIKPVSYKHWFILLLFLPSIGCLSGTRPDVRLSPKLDKRLYQITPLPLTVGIYIEPTLRNYVQEAPLKQDEAGTPYYVFPNFVFPIGETLSSKIEEMSRILFKKAILIDSLQNKEFLNKEALDGILAISLKNSEIELHMDVSVWRAIGRHNLSIAVSFLDPKLNKVWNSEVAVEGKGLDFITSRVEHEWWITTGPKFGPAVDDAVQKLTYELAQKIIASKEISEIKN
ncbi:MAG TPA: hypothetical protein VI727_00780 [Candidatus Brocadiaceae bacterium]|nr:hypothetical protein [Candidatus Brocadiaceae bacterium]